MFNKLKKNGILTRIALCIVDAIIIILSGTFAFWVRFDFAFARVPNDHFEDWAQYVPMEIIITILIFAVMHMYRFMWEAVSAGDLGRMIVSGFLAKALSFITQRYILKTILPRSVVFISFIFSLLGFIGLRFVVRIYNGIRQRRGIDIKPNYTKVMIIGAGAACNMLVREYMSSKKINAKICCIIDDDPAKWGHYIDGIKIVGGRDEIPYYAKVEQIDEIIFAIPTIKAREQKKILNICKNTSCKLKIVPGIYQIVNNEETNINTETVRDIQVEDLLGRDPVELDLDAMKSFICGKTILVTGGGGSIGSELCRQIAKLSPKKLIILDIYENNAYDIQQELKRNYKQLNLSIEIASVRDKVKTYEIFDKYKPEIVFHAAAHKHVPLMEDCPSEAIKNNIFGTWHVMRAAEKYGCKKFVEISTDKAVNPTNVMGATKRFCEMMLMSKKNSITEFSAVRFGNVLGSNGSVVPLFKKQIEKGGPVTLTDKRIIRYFMTIPEAAQLVLEAGSMALRNQIFVLDMGEPVKILDLAENLISLSGHIPYKDIDIVEIGLRPGEKLYEELLMSSKDLNKTPNKKIFMEEQEEIPETKILEQLERLDKAINKASDKELVELLHELVPTFKTPEEYNKGR